MTLRLVEGHARDLRPGDILYAAHLGRPLNRNENHDHLPAEVVGRSVAEGGKLSLRFRDGKRHTWWPDMPVTYRPR
jgi:hypothetical protein